MRILAIDPGYEQTAFCEYEPDTRRVCRFGILPNDDVLNIVGTHPVTDTQLVLEMVASYGMAVGREVFETVFWIGRFYESFAGARDRIYRRDVKLHLCGTSTAKDSNIRTALLDRFGPGKEKAVGTKKNPGPLYGISADVWAALAVAVTWADKHAAVTV